MKHNKKFCKAYVFEKVRSNEIIKLLSLFPVKNVFMEINNIEKNSSFYNNMLNRKGEKGLFLDLSSKDYADIFIAKRFDENFTDILDEIIESNPEILAFYLTDLSLEEFLYHKGKTREGRLITEKVAVCVFELLFDENTFIICFDSDLFHQSDLKPMIEEIFMEIWMLK